MQVYLHMSRHQIEQARRHGPAYWDAMAAAVVAEEGLEDLVQRAVARGIATAFGRR